MAEAKTEVEVTAKIIHFVPVSWKLLQKLSDEQWRGPLWVRFNGRGLEFQRRMNDAAMLDALAQCEHPEKIGRLLHAVHNWSEGEQPGPVMDAFGALGYTPNEEGEPGDGE